MKSLKDLIPGHKKSRQLQANLDELRLELDNLKSKLDLSSSLQDAFSDDRASEQYLQSYAKEEPLITVCVATYNRGELLVDRCIRSIREQSYRNIEIIVVGDCCTDDTAARVAKIADTRLRFHNLEQRGRYPSLAEHRWMVAGSTPMNFALQLAQGDFITHLDDDDSYMPDRIEKLTAFIQKHKADIVWHPFWNEAPDGRWTLNECPLYKKGCLTTSSVLYHNWFRQIPWDLEAYRYKEPGDWNRFRKIRYLGAKAVRYPEPLLRHYRERSQRSA